MRISYESKEFNKFQLFALTTNIKNLKLQGFELIENKGSHVIILRKYMDKKHFAYLIITDHSFSITKYNKETKKEYVINPRIYYDFMKEINGISKILKETHLQV